MSLWVLSHLMGIVDVKRGWFLRCAPHELLLSWDHFYILYIHAYIYIPTFLSFTLKKTEPHFADYKTMVYFFVRC